MQDLASTRVWLDHRHAVFRLGMATCLTSDGCVVTGESSGFRPTPALRGTDVLLFECQGAGLRQAVRLAEGTGVRLIAVVHHPTEAEVSDIVGAGIDGILIRDEVTCEAVSSYVHAVASGSTSLPHDIFRRLLQRAHERQANGSGLLTERERSVLRLLAEGSDTHQIAADLCFSERTVKNVVHDILMKLNCRTRAHAVAQATRAGVI